LGLAQPAAVVGLRPEGGGWVIYEEAAVVKSSGQAPESAG